jgi:hypothetical protein
MAKLALVKYHMWNHLALANIEKIAVVCPYCQQSHIFVFSIFLPLMLCDCLPHQYDTFSSVATASNEPIYHVAHMFHDPDTPEAVYECLSKQVRSCLSLVQMLLGVILVLSLSIYYLLTEAARTSGY